MLFIVDRDLPGISEAQLEQARRRARAASAEFTASGRPIAYFGSLWIPGDARAVCLFNAADATLVEEVNRVARFPFLRVAEAVILDACAESMSRPDGT